MRGLGDALGTPASDGVHMTAAWPSWFSPIGWEQQTAAFTANRPAPLLLGIGFAAVCAIAVFALQSRRDSGASLLPEGAGRRDAGPLLSGSFGLAWRLHWPTLIGWCVGGAAIGVLAGWLAKLVQQAAGTDPTVGNVLRSLVPAGGVPISQVLISVMFSLIGILAAACAVQAIVRMRQEESSQTAELILATPVGRVRWMLDYMVLGAVAFRRRGRRLAPETPP
jgi:ABC-2 type transport system permease protein